MFVIIEVMIFTFVFFSSNSYKILNSRACTEIPDDKKAATEVLDSVGLDADKYRVGNTKVRFFYTSTYKAQYIKLSLFKCLKIEALEHCHLNLK